MSLIDWFHSHHTVHSCFIHSISLRAAFAVWNELNSTHRYGTISLRSLIIQFHSIQLIDWNGLIHWTRYIRHSVNTPFSRPFSLRDSCLAHLVSFGLFFIHSGSLHSIKQPSFIKFNELFIPFHYINLLSLNSFHSKFIAHTISLSSINFTHLTFVELIWVRSMKTKL